MAQESPFKIDELFFSTTDKKGLITSGNDVFQRVSEYSFEELLGKPHNTIRHPDMPRAVFRLLWDYLKKDRSIVAYVKNRSKFDKYYWVLAYVKPIPGGYLSIRLKPTSPLLKQVEELYAQMLRLERETADRGPKRNEAMELSTALLIETINTLGFDSYDRFMEHAFATELSARAEFIAKSPNRASSPLGELTTKDSLLEKILIIEEALSEAFERLTVLKESRRAFGEVSCFVSELTETMRLLSLNASVEASKMGEMGKAVATLSAFLGQGSNRIFHEVDLMSKGIFELMPQVYALLIEISAAKLQVEMLRNFLIELGTTEAAELNSIDALFPENSTKRRLENLLISFTSCTSAVTKQMVVVEEKFKVLYQLVENVTRGSKELSFVHVSGKIEAARLPADCSFGLILNSVSEKIQMADEELRQFMLTCTQVVNSLSLSGEGISHINDSLSQIKASQSETGAVA